MGYQTQIYPEIWLSIITALVFFPMMFLLQQRSNFDLWRFTLLFALIITVIYFYAFLEIRKSFKPKTS